MIATWPYAAGVTNLAITMPTTRLIPWVENLSMKLHNTPLDALDI